MTMTPPTWETPRPLRLGTRGSRLALAQAELVVAALEAHGMAVEVVVIRTAGDLGAPASLWGEGAFVGALEAALLAGDVDLAVHSTKDLPTRQDSRLAVAAFLPRADPRDALVGPVGEPGTVATLRAGARVGTDSPRRSAFLGVLRPDLHFVPLHGNVDTRLRRLDEGAVDALVLAAAGLDRLGRGDRIGERLDPRQVPPAPGQGAIAVQVRAEDPLIDRFAALDHRPTRLAVTAERAFLAASGGGCRAPLGALATMDGERLVLVGGIVDGGRPRVAEVEGPAEAAAELGASLAGILARPQRRNRLPAPSPVPRGSSPHQPPGVLVTRPAGQNQRLAEELTRLGLRPLCVPTIAIEPAPAGQLAAELGRLLPAGWIVVTSANGARILVDAIAATPLPHPVRWAAVGPATAAILRQIPGAVPWSPAHPSGAALGAELPAEPGERVILVRGDLADGDLPTLLRQRGLSVDELVVYRTREGPPASRPLLAEAVAAGLAGLTFASGSAVRGLVALAGPDLISVLRSLPTFCIGTTTASVARAEGFVLVQVAEDASDHAIASLAARHLLSHPPAEAR
jgi:hydroxymethylbilane synthase